MRAREFVFEDSGATVSGSIASVSQPLGGPISRMGIPNPAKYSNSVNPVTKRKKKDARG